MRELADERGVDLLLVDTGDRVDGNGLYDGSTPKGKYTYDIFKEQDIDIICTGNHELYKADTAANEYTKTVPNFKNNYLASNLDIINPKTRERVPLSRRYNVFTTKNQGIKIAAFGFLFDFVGNANNSFVQPVEETIQEVWFQQAIREKVDLFVVIGHVTPRSTEFNAIYNAIRAQNWDTPIQFFGGHSHIRDYMSYDSKAHTLQSGRYMETVGWMSIDGIKPKHKEKSVSVSKTDLTFQRRYIDNNLYGFYYHTGLNESSFHTERGMNVSKTIHEVRQSMNLDQTFGCAPQDYWLNRAKYPSKDSAFSLVADEIFPGIINGEGRDGVPRIAIMNTGGFRFDIFQGKFTKDTTLIVSPFKNQFKYIKNVPWNAAKRILPLINAGAPVFEFAGLQAWTLQPPEQMSYKHDIIPDPYVSPIGDHETGAQAPLQARSNGNGKLPLVPGYTTQDDGGDDGDDTVHSPLSFYRVPNCIESRIAFPAEKEPETVDVVFIDFVEPWIVLALRFAGQETQSEDILDFKAGKSFTGLLAEWVEEHWKGDC
jgi:hypothetical protein